MRLRAPSPLTPLPRGEGKSNSVAASRPRLAANSRQAKTTAAHSIVVLVIMFATALPSASADAATVGFSTFFGGNASDQINDVAIDQVGNVYFTGYTNSDNFPIVRALQDSRASQGDMFVAKITGGGDSLAFSTYLGGNGNDQATGIAIDSRGRIWICGWTTSTNLATVAPIQAQNGGGSDAFVYCLSNHGDSVLFASYLGGSGNDRAADIAVDAAGNVYITGSTNSVNFPVVDALIDTLAGTEWDAFICKINAATKTLRFSSYFGGSGADVSDRDGRGCRTDNLCRGYHRFAGPAFVAATSGHAARRHRHILYWN